jgi:hypothetical protein
MHEIRQYLWLRSRAVPQLASDLVMFITAPSSCNSETVVMFGRGAAQTLAVLPSITHIAVWNRSLSSRCHCQSSSCLIRTDEAALLNYKRNRKYEIQDQSRVDSSAFLHLPQLWQGQLCDCEIHGAPSLFRTDILCAHKSIFKHCQMTRHGFSEAVKFTLWSSERFHRVAAAIFYHKNGGNRLWVYPKWW